MLIAMRRAISTKIVSSVTAWDASIRLAKAKSPFSAALAMSAGIVFGVPNPAEWRGWIIAKDVVISAAGAIYVIAWLLTRKIE